MERVFFYKDIRKSFTFYSLLCSIILKYLPPPLTSSACDPHSTTLPSSMTKILSAFCTVFNLWATTRVVIFPSPATLSSASCTTLSDSLSSAAVASSNRSSEGFLTIALAIAMRCFWPPLRETPLSPHTVS